MSDENLSEELIYSWVKLTGIIKNNRITKGLMYNEAIVMMLVYNKYRKDGTGFISFKELLKETNMLKSLLNRTINNLISRGLIEKVTGETDKRTVYIKFVPEKIDVFLSVHGESMALASDIIKVIGEEDAKALIRISEKLGKADYKMQ